MRFCTIYEVKRADLSVVLSKVVSCRNLTEEQFDSLADYFTDNIPISNYTEVGKVATFKLLNKNEFLEDSPLPDGTIVMADSFKEDGEYIVALGNTGLCAEEIRVAVNLEI